MMARPMANTKASLCNISNKYLPTHVIPVKILAKINKSQKIFKVSKVSLIFSN